MEDKPLKINLVLPTFTEYAGGGVKVMYEYAKRLSARGHDVVVYHSTKTTYTTYETKSESKIYFKFIKRLITGKYKLNERPPWYHLPDSVKCRRVPYISDRFIRDADITMSTWWGTAYDVAKLSSSKGKLFNLVQAYETIMTTYAPELVHESYKLPLHYIVISGYLYDVVSKYNHDKIYYVANGIDLSVYKVIEPVADRDPYSLIMRYTTQKEKACYIALEAYAKLKEKYPQLKVLLFGSEERTSNIPEWIEYIYGQSDITPLYNRSSIFVSSSIDEGMPLPPMEAMACGCACVCTDIPPHMSYMVDNENCLLVPTLSPDAIVEKVSFLIENQAERLRLAKGGIDSMKNYDWEKSVDEILNIFDEAPGRKL